jgi:hypothetical protein
VLSFLAHPALTERFTGEGQKVLAELVARIKRLYRPETYDLRLEIAALSKQVISELKVASAGADPTATLPEALVHRDIPERFFEITLSDGRSYLGLPVL